MGHLSPNSEPAPEVSTTGESGSLLSDPSISSSSFALPLLLPLVACRGHMNAVKVFGQVAPYEYAARFPGTITLSGHLVPVRLESCEPNLSILQRLY